MGESTVAIVGMACVEPGAPDMEAFWANVVDGVDSITEVPPSRWDPERHFAAGADPADVPALTEPMSVSKWGGFIPDVGFDALAWGIPPVSLASIDPAQLLALKVAAAALDDAGYAASPGAAGRDFDRDQASLVFATGSGGVIELSAGIALRVLLRSHAAGRLPAELDAFLPQLTPDCLPGVLTSVIAGRVANRLDFGGKNLTVDSACASVLVALDIACSELGSGSSDLVLCGGVDLHNGAQDYHSFTAAGALSPRGRCYAFDVDADGMTLAEGAGCLVLKRLADAERDGDRIYAVVRGVAGSSDGRHRGLTAPRQEGQVKAVRRAYAAAGCSPAEVGLVEAHGTGTATGDRIELATITEIFTKASADVGSVVLGSVKSNIGHTKCASGIASLIKSAKAAYHGVLPPTLHISQPNELWDARTSPFVFLDRARPWLEDRRLVGVSGFGFGGTNFHAVLENHRSGGASGTPRWGRHHWPAELVALRARSDQELSHRLVRLSERLGEALTETLVGDRWRLRDIAAAESATGQGPVRLTIVAHEVEDLAAKLRAARDERFDGGVYRVEAAGLREVEPEVVFVVPDREAARVGMAADLLVAFSAARGPAAADAAAVDAMLPPQAFGEEAVLRQAAALAEAADAAVTVAWSTVAAILTGLGVIPAAVVGSGAPLLDRGAGIVVTLGPGEDQGSVSGISRTYAISRSQNERGHLVIATDRPGEHGITGLLHALAQLVVAGVHVDLDALHAGRDSRPDRWSHPPKAPGWIVNGHCARTASGHPLPKGLRPADQTPPIRLLGPGDPLPTAPRETDAADVAVVSEYLRLVHGIMAAGSDLIRNQAAELESVQEP